MKDSLNKALKYIRETKHNSLQGCLVHLSIMLVVSWIIITYFFDFYLPTSTNHGEKIYVPDLKHMSIEEARVTLEKHDLVLADDVDTIININEPWGKILLQNPTFEDSIPVKSGRRVYVTINTLTPPTGEITENFINKTSKTSVTDVEFHIKGVFGESVNIVKIKSDTVPEGLCPYVLLNGKFLKPGQVVTLGDTFQMIVGTLTKEQEAAIQDSLDQVDNILDDEALFMNEEEGPVFEIPEGDGF